MIADKVDAALKTIPYPNDAVSNSEYSTLLRAYDDAKRTVITDFRHRLANEYASNLPEPVQDKIWSKSWNVLGLSYFDVEIAYIDNAEFARFARDTK